MGGTLDGTDFVMADGSRLKLPAAPKNADGSKVVLGIRPEHLRLDAQGLPAEVITLEPTGSETQVAARLGGHDIVGVFRERLTVRPGETLQISPDPNTLHLFDAQTGARITL